MKKRINDKVVLRTLEDVTFEKACTEEDFTNKEFSENPKNKIYLDFVLFDSCRFVNIDFSLLHIEKLSFINCEFKSCVFKNGTTSKASFYTCDFLDSKIENLILSSCQMEKIRFINLSSKYFSLTSCYLKDIVFIDSLLKEVSFQDNKSENISFSSCQLYENEFFHTSFLGTDFSSSLIEGIRIDLDSIRGATFSREQGLELVKMLGVNIK